MAERSRSASIECDNITATELVRKQASKQANERKSDHDTKKSAPACLTRRIGRGPIRGTLPSPNRDPDSQVVRVPRKVKADAPQPPSRHRIAQGNAVQKR